MKLKELFIPLTGLALISLASPSYATGWDYKHLPGSACQPQFRAFGGDLRSVEYGDLTNYGTSDVEVICPLVRDDIFSTYLDPHVIVRSVLDQTIRCSFKVMNRGAQVVQNEPTSTTSGLPTTLYFGVVAGTGFGHEGSYVISCSLPPGTQVIQYGLGEYYADDAHRTDFGN